jgi:hypothetical protein
LSVPDRCPLTALLLAAAFLLAAVFPAAAQVPEAPVFEPEAPATLLPLKIGDTGVDISLAGSWTASASYGFGSLLVPGGQPRSLDGLPGIALGPAFSQVPDLSLSLTLLERWFIEVSILGGFDANSLLMGYRGDGEEPVRHVLLGTRDITTAATPFLETPAQADGSLGLSALVVSGIGTNEAMIRWDATGERRRTYLGADELLEERIGLGAWIRGRFFVLPDEGVEDLVVLLEDHAGTLDGGDGRRYRQAGPADVILDAAAGRVTLRTQWKGRVLAFYRKGAFAVGDPDASMGVGALPDQTLGRRDLDKPRIKFDWNLAGYLGENMVDRRIRVPDVIGDDYLLLWEPGDLSPFQAANAYAFTFAPPADPARLRAFLEPKVAGAAPPQPILFLADPDLKVVNLLVDRGFRSQGRNWYPFWKSPADDPVNLLYGPGRDSLDGLLDLELVVQSLQKVDGYVLGSDVVASSVRVTMNGLEERRFVFDGATGRITFQVEIAPSDRVEVRWRTADAAAAGGDLLLTWRDDVRLAQNLGLWVAAGLRWNVGSGLTAGEPYARSGALVAAAGLNGTLEGTAGRLAWSVEAAGSFANPDTTGVVRLHGMEGDSLAVDLSEELAWPAAPPEPPGPLSAFDADSRGRLRYQDFRSYDAFGGVVLHDIDWPGAVPREYETGGRPGPYEVLGSSAGSSTGKSLVLEYGTDIPLAIGEWVGTQLPLVAGSLADLSTAKSVTIRMKGVDLAGSAQVWIEIGAIGEDLDGDGVLDAEPSSTSTGFSFDDTGNVVVLKIGAGPRLEGNRIRDSEDRDGNGALTPENTARIVTLGPAAVSGSWAVFSFPLGDADRAKLEQARAIRIIVESTAAGTAGRVLIDQVAVAGSPYWVESSSGSVTVQEIAESLSAGDPGPGNRLGDVEPEAMNLFHPDGGTQEVLEAGWKAPATGLTVTGYTSKTTGGITYDAAVIYVRGTGNLPGSGASILFELLDADGDGIHWTLDAADVPDDAWHELRVSRIEGSIRVDGGPSVGTPTFDAAPGELGMLRVVVSGLDGLSAGALFLDEVHLREPRSAFGAGARAEASWSRPGAIWQPGGVAVLANLDVVQQLSAVTAGFATLYGVPSAVADLTSRTGIGIDVLYARLAADIVLRGVDGSFASSGGHRLTIPAAASPVTLSDSFSLAGTGEFSRSDSLRIRPSERLSVGIEARATGTAQALDQSWTGTLALQPLDRLDLGLDLLVSQSSTGYALADAWYGARWAREAALLAPWNDGATLERVERLSAQLGAGWGAFEGEISLAGSATGSGYDAPGRAQEDRIDQAWSVSWSSREGETDEVVVTLRYARSLSMAGPRGAGEPFTDEAATFFALLGDQRWYLLGVPVVEIFLDDTDRILESWDGLTKASWSPSLGITLERRAGSRLSDLFAPSSVSLTLARDLERRGDVPENEITLRPRLVTHAMNLFGRLGSHPVADFYRTDEFRIALSATVAGARAAELGLSEMGLELYAEFLGFRDQSLVMVNVFTLGEDAKQAKDGLQATFAWATHPAGGVRLPYLPAEIAKTGFLEHRESLDLDLAVGGEPAHPLTLLLGHSTSLEYPDRGSLKAGLKAGFDIESMAGSYAFRFAFEANIEAKITF